MSSHGASRSSRVHLKQLRRAAELGHPDGMRDLADALAEAGRFAEARRWYLRAVRRGDTIAAFNLAITWQRTGRHALAVQWLRRVARSDDGALLELARAELAGLGTRRDVRAALTKLQRVVRSRSVCQLDQEEAMLMLSDVYRQGWFVPRNYPIALQWLRRAARAGSNAASGLLRDLDEAENP